MGNVGSCLGKQIHKKKKQQPAVLLPYPCLWFRSLAKMVCLSVASGLVHSGGERRNKSSSQASGTVLDFPVSWDAAEAASPVPHTFPPASSSLLAVGVAQPQPTSTHPTGLFLGVAKFSVSSEVWPLSVAYMQGGELLCQVSLGSGRSCETTLRKNICASR